MTTAGVKGTAKAVAAISEMRDRPQGAGAADFGGSALQRFAPTKRCVGVRVRSVAAASKLPL